MVLHVLLTTVRRPLRYIFGYGISLVAVYRRLWAFPFLSRAALSGMRQGWLRGLMTSYALLPRTQILQNTSTNQKRLRTMSSSGGSPFSVHPGLDIAVVPFTIGYRGKKQRSRCPAPGKGEQRSRCSTSTGLGIFGKFPHVVVRPCDKWEALKPRSIFMSRSFTLE